MVESHSRRQTSRPHGKFIWGEGRENGEKEKGEIDRKTERVRGRERGREVRATSGEGGRER